jgi:hypothetical protein
MSEQDNDPTDQAIETKLRGISPAAWAALWVSVDRLDALPGSQVQRTDKVVRPTDDGMAFSFNWSNYPGELTAVVDELYKADIVTPFNWSDWNGINRFQSGSSFAGVPVADAVRYLTATVRAERFSDGAIGTAVSQGTFGAALSRIRDWHREATASDAQID